MILYIVPEGRVAYWADWHLLGLTKTQWGDVHTAVGTLFLLFLLLHIWLNWKPLMNYLKNRRREMVVMTAPMVIAFILVFVVFAGTLAGLPPMSTLLDYGARIKADAAEVYGNPPYGHAETSPLKKFCGFLGLDVNVALSTLRAAGFDDSVTGRHPDQGYRPLARGEPAARLRPHPRRAGERPVFPDARAAARGHRQADGRGRVQDLRPGA